MTDMGYSKDLGNVDHISGIPPELLADIFKLARQPFEPEPDEENVIPDRIPTEVLISHVSGFWRTLALTTRVLWRHISIGRKETVEKVRMYLDRSDATPLCVQLHLIDPLKSADLREKINLVFSHLDRWERVTVHSSIETSELPIVSRLYDARAPVLETLRLHIHDVDSENLKSVRRTDLEQILTHGCPRLSVLRLRGLSMHFFRPPLTNVTTLHLEQTRGLFIGYECFKYLLTSAPALACLSIHDTIIDEWTDVWPQDSLNCIHVPSLISLRLSMPGTLRHVFSDILIAIWAPQLESLVLKQVGETHLDRFLTFSGVSSKFPSLRSLVFEDFDLSSYPRLARMCTAFPGITHFTCTSGYAPKVLSLMAGRFTEYVVGLLEGDPWTSLDTLTTNLLIQDVELLRDAVERRKRTGYPLRVLRLLGSMLSEEIEDEDDEEDLEWLYDNVTVERFQKLDPWPPGSGYDPDDTAF